MILPEFSQDSSWNSIIIPQNQISSISLCPIPNSITYRLPQCKMFLALSTKLSTCSFLLFCSLYGLQVNTINFGVQIKRFKMWPVGRYLNSPCLDTDMVYCLLSSWSCKGITWLLCSFFLFLTDIYKGETLIHDTFIIHIPNKFGLF